MQSPAATNLIANSTDPGAIPAAKLEIGWYHAAGNVVWTDETANFLSAKGHMAISDPTESISAGGAGIASTCDIVLDNLNQSNDVEGRYSSGRTDSPLYQYIQNGQIYAKDIRLSLGYKQAGTAETLRRFTGNIFDIADAYPASTVALSCMDYAQNLINNPIRTVMYSSFRVDQILTVLQSALNLPSVALDRDLFILPYWWADSESTWGDINSLVRSVGGRVYFDEAGTLTFENMHHWLQAPHTTSQWTFLVSNFRDMIPQYQYDDIWDGVIVEYAPLQESYAQIIYDYKGPSFSVPPKSAKTFSAVYPRPATGVYTPVGGAPPTEHGNTDHKADNRDYVFTNAGGDDMNTSITVSVAYYAQRTEVTVTNASAVYTAFMNRFQLRGRPLDGAPAGEVRYDSGQSVVSFPRIKEIRGEIMIQTESQADALAHFLRDRLEKPRQFYHLRHVQAVPMLQLGDRVTITNARQLSSSAQGFVTAIGWQYDKSGYWMDLDILDATGLYPFANPFIVGTSKYGPSAVTNSGRIVY